MLMNRVGSIYHLGQPIRKHRRRAANHELRNRQEEQFPDSKKFPDSKN